MEHEKIDVSDVVAKARQRISTLNEKIIDDIYDCDRLKEIREKIVITEIDEETRATIIALAEEKLDIILEPSHVNDIFQKRIEDMVAIKFHKSAYTREVYILDAISEYFIGCKISERGGYDADAIKHEIKTSAMESDIEVKNFFFMNREF